MRWPDAIVALFVACTPASAQQTSLGPSSALACLTPGPAERGGPAYPPEALERKDGGTVEVELTFVHPTRAPSIKVVDAAGTFVTLVEAVLEHTKLFRVPCLKPGDAPVVLRQQYVFVPNDGRKVMASALTDAADPRRTELLQCMVNKAGDKLPNYPEKARRKEEQGNFLLDVHFVAADAPPQLKMIAAPKEMWRLRAAVERYADDLRMPCLPVGEAMTIRQAYQFRLDGGARTLLRDVGLLSFLRGAKQVPRPVYFDLDRMGCPFSVRIQYFRPHEANAVSEVDNSNPARLPLLDWLSKIEINLSEALSQEVLGSTLDVLVPCGKIDL